MAWSSSILSSFCQYQPELDQYQSIDQLTTLCNHRVRGCFFFAVKSTNYNRERQYQLVQKGEQCGTNLRLLVMEDAREQNANTVTTKVSNVLIFCLFYFLFKRKENVFR